jgi:hypothetical protein
MKPLATWAAALTLAVSAGSAQAALTDLGDGTVLDTNTNIVWLKNWDLVGNNNGSQLMNDIAALVTAGHSTWIMPSSQDFVQLWLNAGGSYAAVQANFVGVDNENWTSGGDRFVMSTGLYNRLRGHEHYSSGARLDQLYVAAVPEPQSLALVLLALGGAGLATRRRGARAARNTGAVGLSVC